MGKEAKGSPEGVTLPLLKKKKEKKKRKRKTKKKKKQVWMEYHTTGPVVMDCHMRLEGRG